MSDFVQVNVDLSLGPLLAGTYLASGLLALELLQAWKFFSRGTQGTPTKWILALLLVIDICCTVFQYTTVWQYLISHWGDIGALMVQQWPFNGTLITTTFTALIVQSFLVLRAWKLSRSVVVAGILSIFVAASLAGGLATGSMLALHATYTERSLLTVPITYWFSISAGTDVLIALTLIFYLNRIRVQAERFEQSRLRGSIGSLIKVAVETGSVTSAFALIIMGTYLQNPESNVPSGLAFSLGRLYSLSMLGNLNAAHTIAKKTNATMASNAGFASKYPGGVSVNHATIVQYEGGQSDPIHLDSLSNLTQHAGHQQTFDRKDRSSNEKSNDFENVSV